MNLPSNTQNTSGGSGNNGSNNGANYGGGSSNNGSSQRGSANNSSGGQGGGNPGNQGTASTRNRKKSRKKPKLDPVKYWGDPSALPVRNDYVLETSDPTAVIRSLGKAPIPGKNSAPELYFEVLYKRAAVLAQALAFAGGLNQDEPPTQSDPVAG